MVKDYKFSKNANKIAKENGLRKAEDYNFFAGSNVLYDCSLFDEANIPNEAKEMLIDDLIKYNSISWYDEKPVPVLVDTDKLHRYYASCRTTITKIYSGKTWKRVAVIVDVVGLKITEMEREDVWHDFSEVQSNTYHSRYLGREEVVV